MMLFWFEFWLSINAAEAVTGNADLQEFCKCLLRAPFVEQAVPQFPQITFLFMCTPSICRCILSFRNNFLQILHGIIFKLIHTLHATCHKHNFILKCQCKENICITNRWHYGVKTNAVTFLPLNRKRYNLVIRRSHNHSKFILFRLQVNIR